MALDLQEIRGQLDQIDDQLTALFVQRMGLASEAAAYKQEHGLPILDADREEAILERLSQKAGGELKPYVQRLYQTLFAISREYQRAQLKEKR